MPHPIDIHVGSRVRLRRILMGISQEKLGDELGLTFQQVQKYEKGTNRIGASRLHAISLALDVPVQFLFDDAPSNDNGHNGFREPTEQEAMIQAFINSREGVELVRAFTQIVDSKVQKKVVALVSTLASD